MAPEPALGDTAQVGDLGRVSDSGSPCVSGGRRGACRAGPSNVIESAIMDSQERRSDLARRRRIDALLARVSEAREEIVEAGLDAVQDSAAADDKPRGRRFARAPKTDADAASASARPPRHDR
jgi:hypothetical protein